MIKTVLDTNVIISGLLWGGIPNKILKSTQENKISIYSSLDILYEIENVLKRQKFKKRIDQLETNVDDLMSNLLSIILVFDVSLKLDIIKEDPDDNKFIECAFELGINKLVSGDIHLLNLKRYKFINIYSPNEFYNTFKNLL